MAKEIPTQPTLESFAVSIGRLEGKLDQVANKVDAIHDKLYGNGTPGLIVDQERQSAQIAELLKIAQTNAGNIDSLKKQTPGRWLVANWKTVGLIIVFGFVLLHSFIPADLSIWTWISKLFGGP